MALRKKAEAAESKEDGKRREFASAVWNAARAAKDSGRSIFSFSMEIASDQSTFGINRSMEASPDEILDEIERLGWSLEHVDHVHVPRGASTGGVSNLGNLSMSTAAGVTVGHYYFRSR